MTYWSLLVSLKVILFITFLLFMTSTAAVYGQESPIEWMHLSSTTGDLSPPGNSAQQTTSLVLDVDNDGINDFVIAGRLQGPSVVWYQLNTDGWTKYLIDDESLNIEAGGTFSDIDGDGDLDVVMGGDFLSNKVWWWENPYPNYDPNTPWARRQIKNLGANKHHDQIFGDFNGDGQDELVFWNQGAKKLFITNIPADPKNTQPWFYTEIYSWSSGDDHEGLAKADIDGDGKIDIVGGGRWFQHNGGTNYTAYVIDDSHRLTRAASGQLKAGGRPEVVFVTGDGVGRLKWFEWTGGGWEGHDLLGFDVDHGHSLEVADIDGDAYLDIFVAEMRLDGGNDDAKMLIFLGDGNGNFTQTNVSTGFGNHESKVGDLDGDGDLDILGKPYNWDTPRVDVWLNNGEYSGGKLPLDRWERHVVDSDKPWRALFITSADVDGDSRKDIITGGWWYRNPGSPGNTWMRNTIGLPLNNMATVYDFDGDGYVDVLGTEGQGSEANALFVWARNDGSGLFTIFDNVSNANGDFLQGVELGRFKTDGSLEIALSWHDESTGLQSLTVPSDPANETWNWDQISNTSQWEDLSGGDIDEDGHLDLLLGTKWLRNEEGVWSPCDIYDTTDKPDRNRLVDVNGDDRLDVVVGFEAISQPGKLAWYEQGSSPTSTWTEHVIATIVGPMSLDVADMDGDGDIDVVVGEHNLSDPSSAKLYVFENTGSQGTDWTEHMVCMGDEHHDGAQLVDIDGDGDLDIISIGWSHGRVLLYENKAIVSSPSLPPTITTQPTDQTVIEGETATFTVVAEGTEPLIYQWQKGGVDISGAASATYTTPATTYDDNGATFRCVVTNDYGTAISDEAILNVMTIISATVETDPVPTTGDAADDPCIWIHPTDPSLSTIIGTDKWTGLAVYDLAGNEIQYISDVIPNNVDIRYNFPLAGERVALVGYSGMVNNRIGFYKVNPATRLLENVTAREINPGMSDSPYGFCMYHSPISGKYYAFVTSKGVEVQQWELFDNGSGMVDATMVRSFAIGSRTEGCVADDEYAVLYAAEEDVGIWKYGAEPDDGTTRTMVDSTGTGGHLAVEVEGLTLYYASDGTGYLIASSQGANEFVIYEREGDNSYVMTFDIEAGNGIDAVSHTDGIDVVNFPLSDKFPMGVFVAQDDANDVGNQNFKLVLWESIANAVFSPLTIDLTWDPREVGGGPLPPAITTQPADQSVTEGETATFTVVAEGTEPLTYQWQKGGVDISGAASATYTTPGTTMADDGATFRCVVTNDQGTDTSDTATLTVTPAPVPPTITGQPENQTVTEGETATFTVVAEGTVPLTYQWQKGGVDISGAAGATYTTPGTTMADDGTQFRCVVTNAYGSTTSNEAILTVLDTDPDLTGSWVTLDHFWRGKNRWIQGTFNVENQGNQEAKSSSLRFYLSSDDTFNGTNILISTTTVGALKAGQSADISLKKKLPKGESREYIISIVDADNNVTETDETNNMDVSGPLN